ncbi:Hypothetical Protein FCC1311_074202 [Hondaea fermentalgiana]|uniref:Peptidase M10 metallopeptidase domain-containing protein n=1 Tax=Hondaea fermentalgiana TaxID=2315210 RepID=A0A2R5GLL0_9STRA|nr:Hypothetical Protein FCC1311_074202 [Hondaea fermentalgiana]|eukprot:GBG31199.1 Hypothetical Protein FCC1311_074202 [Hondaea fermentalgiana]
MAPRMMPAMVAAMALLVSQATADFIEIELVSNTLSDYEDRIETAITNAATNWSNHDAITFEEETSLSDFCGIDYTFASGDSVDNLLILVQVIANGEDASFITAKPCIFAQSDDTYFTRVGVITVNSDSSRTVKMLDHYHFEEIIEHEIGHVLGVGSLWDAFGLVDADSKTYTGSKGIWGYQLVGGSDEGVPLDVNSSSIYHWSQSVFEDELMTGTQYGHDQPLSTLTVSSLRDLGYKVWPQNSDEFELSTDSSSSSSSNNSNAPKYLIDLYMDFESVDVSASVPVFSNGAVSYAVIDFEVSSSSSSTSTTAASEFVKVELVSNTLSDYEDRIETAITNAATNWSNVIRTEHDAITFEEETSLSDFCGIDYTFASGDSVDNLLILVQVIANGEDASFITAKPCIFAQSDDTYFTRVGVITVNSDSSRTVKMLDHYHFEEIIEHEIGHVLGVGSLWDAFGLVDADSKTYTGSKGIWGYQLVGGAGESVPLDVNSSSIYHWSQSVFEDELMTGTQYGHDQPLSTLTVSSLRDLGYKVWPQNSDEFELSTDSSSSTTTNSNAPTYLIDLYSDFEPIDVSASVPIFSDGAVKYAVVGFTVVSASVANKASGWEIATTVLAVIFFCTTIALGSAWYCKSRSLVNIETQSTPSEPCNVKDLERASPAEEHASAVRLH